jgi:hypothetical protein
LSFEALRELLEPLGAGPLEIRSVAVLKVGCTCLSDTHEGALNARFPITAFEELEATKRKKRKQEPDLQTQSLYPSLIAALEKSSNVFDLQRPTLTQQPTEDTYSISIGGERGFFVTGPSFSLKVEMPQRHQQHHDMHWGFSENPIERFGVVSSGSLYAAFARIRSYPGGTNIGHEYRELVRGQIQSETALTCPAFGPVPLHPDIYLVFQKTKVGEGESSKRIYSANDDVFAVFDESRDLLDAAMDILWDINTDATEFYRLAMDRSLLLSFDQEILNHFSDLSDAISQNSSAPWWNVYKSQKAVHKGRQSLGRTYTRLVEFESQSLTYTRERTQFLERVKRNRVFSSSRHYLAEMTESDTNVPPGLYAALNYFSSELQTLKNIRSILVGSLIGAGALLLAAYLTKLWSAR